MVVRCALNVRCFHISKKKKQIGFSCACLHIIPSSFRFSIIFFVELKRACECLDITSFEWLLCVWRFYMFLLQQKYVFYGLFWILCYMSYTVARTSLSWSNNERNSFDSTERERVIASSRNKKGNKLLQMWHFHPRFDQNVKSAEKWTWKYVSKTLQTILELALNVCVDKNVHQPNRLVYRFYRMRAWEWCSWVWNKQLLVMYWNWLIQSRIQWNEWLVYRPTITHKIHNEWIFSGRLDCVTLFANCQWTNGYVDAHSMISRTEKLSQMFSSLFCQSRFFHFTIETLNYNKIIIIIIRLENGWEISFWSQHETRNEKLVCVFLLGRLFALFIIILFELEFDVQTRVFILFSSLNISISFASFISLFLSLSWHELLFFDFHPQFNGIDWQS